MHLQLLLVPFNFTFILTCLFLLYQLTTAALPGASTDLLISKSAPGRLRDSDLFSLASSVSFHPSLVSCTYHGVWGCPIWRVRVSFPPPELGFDSVAGSTIDLPLRPVGSDTNGTNDNPLHQVSTAPESSSLSTPSSRFQSILRETCDSSTDGDSNVSDFQTEGRVDGSQRLEFRLAYARILEDTIPPGSSCVEDALERMFGGGDGTRIHCRIPGAWRDNGPPAWNW